MPSGCVHGHINCTQCADEARINGVIARLQAELTTARQEIAALTRERKYINEVTAHVVADKSAVDALRELIQQNTALMRESGDAEVRAITAEAELTALRAKHRAAVAAIKDVLPTLVVLAHEEGQWALAPELVAVIQRSVEAFVAILTPARPDTAPVGEAIDPYVTRECPSCGENHSEASMCPPHEVRRGTGPWSRR
jgi:hypothetical protein